MLILGKKSIIYKRCIKSIWIFCLIFLSSALNKSADPQTSPVKLMHLHVIRALNTLRSISVFKVSQSQHVWMSMLTAFWKHPLWTERTKCMQCNGREMTVRESREGQCDRLVLINHKLDALMTASVFMHSAGGGWSMGGWMICCLLDINMYNSWSLQTSYITRSF